LVDENMTKCSECGKRIKTGERFILEGNMPFAPGTNFLHGLGKFGYCYHKECYMKKINANKN